MERSVKSGVGRRGSSGDIMYLEATECFSVSYLPMAESRTMGLGLGTCMPHSGFKPSGLGLRLGLGLALTLTLTVTTI